MTEKGEARHPLNSNERVSLLCLILNKKAASRVRKSALREKTDGDLVRAALEGRTQDFGVLITRYMRPGYLVALSVTGNPEDA